MKKRIDTLRPVYVEQLPDLLDPGLLYVSMKFSICAHSCACGCGRKVFTPLGLRDWQLYYDGESITLSPSIGNFRFPCQSHYFIRHNIVVWVKDSEQGTLRKKKKKNRLSFSSLFAGIGKKRGKFG
ncbi:MAG: hypothetical protein IJS30_07365 [Bacteroidales bacterium]|nr:hypothetical protein [Bacteroidales bacterium]